jgi:hypothetical protein
MSSREAPPKFIDGVSATDSVVRSRHPECQAFRIARSPILYSGKLNGYVRII